jgi:YHS domain-containing protein
MARLVLYALFFLFSYFVLRLLFKVGVGKKLRTGSEREPEELVQDPCCQTYVSKRIAVRRKIAGKDYYFCGEGCLKNYLENRNSGGASRETQAFENQ